MAGDGSDAAAEGFVLGHRPGLDQIRGAAVLLVVAQHTLQAVDGWPLPGSGRLGVAIFFTLSGFLVTTILLDHRERREDGYYAGFYWRRIFRLAPALVVCVLLGAAVGEIVGQAWTTPALEVLTYRLNYSLAKGGGGLFEHLWSLSVEEHFYVVWPMVVAVLARLDDRRLAWWLTGVGVVDAAWRWEVASDDPQLAYFATHLRIDALVLGAALACAVRAGWSPSRHVVVPSVLVLAAYAAQVELTDGVVGPELLAVGFASVLVIGRALTWDRRRPALEHIGVVSYGAYLYHLPIYVLVVQVPLVEGVISQAVVTWCLTALVAEASWRFVEVPMREAGRSLSRRPSPPTLTV